jgi:hypothetical protein
MSSPPSSESPPQTTSRMPNKSLRSQSKTSTKVSNRPETTSKPGLKTTPPQCKLETSKWLKISKLTEIPRESSITKPNIIGVTLLETTLFPPLTLMDSHGLLSQPLTQLDLSKTGQTPCKPNRPTINGSVIKSKTFIHTKMKKSIILSIMALSQKTCTK